MRHSFRECPIRRPCGHQLRVFALSLYPAWMEMGSYTPPPLGQPPFDPCQYRRCLPGTHSVTVGCRCKAVACERRGCHQGNRCERIKLHSASFLMISQKGDVGFSKVEILAQQYCGFEGCLVSRLAKRGRYIPLSTVRDAKDFTVDCSGAAECGPASASVRLPQDCGSRTVGYRRCVAPRRTPRG